VPDLSTALFSSGVSVSMRYLVTMKSLQLHGSNDSASDRQSEPPQ
jgi:hypothetical protein